MARSTQPKKTVPKNPEPPKAYQNEEFLALPATRSIRIQCELQEPAVRFEKYGIKNTIVFFGAARIRPPEVAQEELEAVQRDIAKEKALTREQKLRLDHAQALTRTSKYYTAARELSKRLTEWSALIKDPSNRFYICSGGGPGIMEAANRGAYDAGGQTVGMGISLPHEQKLNPYITPELAFEFHYFFIRKYWLFYPAKALVVFPGGFGTMDELFEILTLVQTKKAEKYIPVVLFGKEFWENLFNFKLVSDLNLIAAEDLSLFRICDTVEEAENYIVSELMHYYVK